MDELRDIDSIGCGVSAITILKWEIGNFKNKFVTFMINLSRNNIIRNGQMQVYNTALISGISFIKL